MAFLPPNRSFPRGEKSPLYFYKESIMKYCTGLGTTQVTKTMQDVIERFSRYLSEQGYTIRTDFDKGMNQVFRNNSDSVELYTFEGDSNKNADAFDCPMTDFVKQHLRDSYISLDALNRVTKNRVVRCYYELLGQNLDSPSEFLICYDPSEGVVNYAHRIAYKLGIKVYNLCDKEELKQLKKDWLGE